MNAEMEAELVNSLMDIASELKEIREQQNDFFKMMGLEVPKLSKE